MAKASNSSKRKSRRPAAKGAARKKRGAAKRARSATLESAETLKQARAEALADAKSVDSKQAPSGADEIAIEVPADATAADKAQPDSVMADSALTADGASGLSGLGPPSATAVPSTFDSSTALSRRDPFQAYLREVQRYPLLTAEEESALTRKYQETQDVNIAAQLVTANLRLVIKLAYEYRRAYRNIMDLIQEGNIGLMQAVKRYDPYRGVKLSSYAAWWIRAYMLRFILNNWRLVKLGTTQAQRKLFFNLNKQKAQLSAMGIEPSAKEIASRLGVQEREVIEMDRRMSSSEASLDAPVGDGEGRGVSRSELLPATGEAADETVAAQELGQMVSERLKKFRVTLEGKELTIFDKRMVADDPLTLQKLGDEFGVSRERVRQLEARLSGRLREYLKEELGDAVDMTA